MNTFIRNFREFAVKGNVIDLAVGIIIGAAFNAIVNSLVKDIIMPPFGLIWGDKDFQNYKLTLKPEQIGEQGQVIDPGVAIAYGSFVSAALDFLIIALVIFVVIRFVNRMKRKADDPANKDIPTPREILLLTEIRDLLKSDRK